MNPEHRSTANRKSTDAMNVIVQDNDRLDEHFFIRTYRKMPSYLGLMDRTKPKDRTYSDPSRIVSSYF